MMVRPALTSRKGSIIMEFMLMMPILLLLFGATMLWMDISLGKMYLQEANRNLAWLSKDRYDVNDGPISSALYSSVREPYNLRNKIERNIGGSDDMWRFGSGGVTNSGGYEVEGIPSNYAQKLDVGRFCEWNTMVSGNMELKMARLSGVYMGAVALGSVLHPDGETKHLYAAAYDFTRSRDASGSNDVVAASFNPEAFVIHRAYSNDQREGVVTPNNLLPVLTQGWPTDGTSLQELVGGGENVDMDNGNPEDDPVKDLFLGRKRPGVTPLPVIKKMPTVMAD